MLRPGAEAADKADIRVPARVYRPEGNHLVGGGPEQIRTAPAWCESFAGLGAAVRAPGLVAVGGIPVAGDEDGAVGQRQRVTLGALPSTRDTFKAKVLS